MADSSSCDHNCSSCGEGSCGERKSLIAESNKRSNIKHIVGVVSGKGGVGKSLVTSLLAHKMNTLGYKVGILDGDLTGPSIPKSFGVTKKIIGDDEGMFPSESKEGIKIMSINLLLADDTKPVLWKGLMLAGALKQFYTDVSWGDLDYLFVDMPPGTADIPMTIYQSLPIEGIVIVTTPQDLVSMIVGKSVNMAKTMNIDILGLVENMSYMSCPDCGKKLYPFGKGNVADVASKYGLKVLGSLPIDPSVAAKVDAGEVEKVEVTELDMAVEAIKAL